MPVKERLQEVPPYTLLFPYERGTRTVQHDRMFARCHSDYTCTLYSCVLHKFYFKFPFPTKGADEFGIVQGMYTSDDYMKCMEGGKTQLFSD